MGLHGRRGHINYQRPSSARRRLRRAGPLLARSCSGAPRAARADLSGDRRILDDATPRREIATENGLGGGQGGRRSAGDGRGERRGRGTAAAGGPATAAKRRGGRQGGAVQRDHGQGGGQVHTLHTDGHQQKPMMMFRCG